MMLLLKPQVQKMDAARVGQGMWQQFQDRWHLRNCLDVSMIRDDHPVPFQANQALEYQQIWVVR